MAKIYGPSVAFLALLFAPSVVYAQAHPCDAAPPATVTLQAGAPHKLQFCSADKPEALLANVDGAAFDLVPVTAKTQASTTGQILYESTVFIQVVKGTHTLTAALYNRNEFTGQLQLGAASAPFSFTAVEDTPKAAAPRIINIVK